MPSTLENPQLSSEPVAPVAGAGPFRLRTGASAYDIVLALLLALIYVVPGLFRLVDADEGFYLMAARLVLEGRLLYHDFHYWQMPLLPYVYGAWMSLFGASWYAARILSVLLAVALSLIVSRHVERLTGRKSFGIGAALLLAVTGLGMAWYTTVKTLGLATLLAFASYVVVERRRTRYSPLIAGVLLALASDVRLYVLALAPVLAIAVWHRADPGARRREIGTFALGVAAGVLPVAVYAWADPDVFTFNILGIHALRNQSGYVADWSQKLSVLQSLFGFSSADGGSALQFATLIVINVALALRMLLTREKLPLAFMVGGVLFFLSLMPTPAYTQYMSVVLPFFVVSAALLVHRIGAEAAVVPERRRRLRQAAVVVLVVYVALWPPELYRYTVSGTQVDGVLNRENAANWRIPHIDAVGRFVDSVASGERKEVISFWPGYFIGTRATIAPGFENQFSVLLAYRLPPEQQARYRFMSWTRVWYHLVNRHFPVVVIGNTTFASAASWPREGVERVLVESGYVHARTMGDAKIYVLRKVNPS